MTSNTQVVLKRQCQGVPEADDFEVVDAAMPVAADGEVLCRTLYLSLDPYLRGKISGRHLSGAINPGDLMAGEAVCQVLESNERRFRPNDLLAAHVGWQDYAAVAADDARPVAPATRPASLAVGILGMPGLTAYAGLLRLGQPKSGDTLVVSAAAGPVGSMVGQIGKIKGCRVIGIAGSDEKCQWLREAAGFADTINYKSENLRDGLDRTCPTGIDVYFDNVGGDLLQAVMERLALNARVVLCGLMAQYNTDQMPPGPNPAFIIKARATVRGMVVYDHEDLRSTFEEEVRGWLASEQIAFLEDVTVGLEHAPHAFSRLMRGQNTGKSIVKVATDWNDG